METKAFYEDFDHCKKKKKKKTLLFKSLFEEHILVELLSMAASPKLKIIQFNRS